MTDPRINERNDLHDLVYREIVKKAHASPAFRAVVEPLGFFTLMELVDGIVDALISAQQSGGSDD